MGDQTDQTDPTQQYDQPEHTDQQQPHPGLTQTMQDKPDHGEDSYRGSSRLTGKRAVITGADSGIGRAVALAFAREGADVVLSYLEAEEADADETVSLVEAEGRKAIRCPGDIRSEETCQKIIDAAVEQLGGIDVLVNNAAYQMAQMGGIADITTEQFDQVMKTNLYAKDKNPSRGMKEPVRQRVDFQPGLVNRRMPRGSPPVSGHQGGRVGVASWSLDARRSHLPQAARSSPIRHGGTMLTSHQQSILETLRLSGQPLDDDELSRRTGISPRQSVNQACRALQREGLIRRVPGVHGKLVNLLGDGAAEDEPTAAVSSGLKNALASPVTDAGLRDVEVLEVPPGNSREQREAERVMLDLIGRRRGQTTLSPSRLTIPSSAQVELDGVDPDRTVLVECWVHQGRPKSAQRQKVLADALKLSWIRSTLSPPPELILCLCDPSAAAPFLPGARTWAAQALSDLDIRVEIVQLPPDVLGAVVEAQRRQYR